MGEFRLLYYTCFVQNSPHETDKECRFAKKPEKSMEANMNYTTRKRISERTDGYPHLPAPLHDDPPGEGCKGLPIL